MSLTRWDILAKVDDFAAVSEHARLSRWKWELLEAIDGTRDIGAVAARKLVDTASAITFAEEALAANLVRIVTLSYAEFNGLEETVDEVSVPPPEVAPQPEPEPVLLAVAEPEPEPEPVVLAVAEPEPQPEPQPVAVAEAQPETVPPVQAVPAPAPPTSLGDRMAALRARALKSIEQKPAPAAYASVEPLAKIEPVEFSLSSEPKPEPARSADEIEFSV